jgi:hypothetical protein
MALLFVAGQLASERTPSLREPSRRAIAQSLLNVYLIAFIVPLACLIPSLEASSRAAILFIGAAIGAFRVGNIRSPFRKCAVETNENGSGRLPGIWSGLRWHPSYLRIAPIRLLAESPLGRYSNPSRF